MTLALIDAINKTGEKVLEDTANNFVRWIEDGEFTADGKVFDVGRTYLMAIRNYESNAEKPGE